MTIVGDAQARFVDLVAAGGVCPDDGTADRIQLRLRVPAASRRRGLGPLDLVVTMDGITLAAGRLIWLVTTNKGWAHLRGEGWGEDLALRFPFRVDVFSAAAVRADPPDRIALRLYAPGTDPNVDGPIHKLAGWFETGGARIFGG